MDSAPRRRGLENIPLSEAIMKKTTTLIFIGASLAFAQTQPYDLLLEGGHVIDAKNNIDAVRDVAIKDGKIAAVAAAHRSGAGL